MVTDRLLEQKDLPLLQESLDKDEYHKGMTTGFFLSPTSISKVYADEDGTVLFLRASKVLQVDVQFLDNKDAIRNRSVMLSGFSALAEQAKANGFTSIVFNTVSPPLKRFCIRRLGFTLIEGDILRKAL